MNSIRQRLGLLAALGLLLNVAIVSGQTPAPPQPVIPSQGIMIIPDQEEAAPAPPKNRPWQKLFNSHGMCCASDFDDLACGSFWSECKFIFGSCRTFFREPCVPSSPHFGPGSVQGQKSCGN